MPKTVFSWLQHKLAPGAEDVNVAAPGPARARPPLTFPAPPVSGTDVKLSVRPAADVNAPGEFLIYGLNSCGYVPVPNFFGRRAHLVVVVASVANLSSGELRFGAPYLTFALGAGARKLEPAATRVTLERLTLYDGRAADRNGFPHLAAGWREYVAGNGTAGAGGFALRPRASRLIYAAFLPEGLDALPVFNGEILNFGVTFFPAYGQITFYGFRAPPLRRLVAAFH